MPAIVAANGLERINKELQRTQAPNPNSNAISQHFELLAIDDPHLAEQDEEWMTAKNLPQHEDLTAANSRHSKTRSREFTE